MLGKGDAMWRALAVLTGEVVCFLDADSEHFGAHFACGLLGPLLCGSEISFVKGMYRRPFRVGDTTLPDGGGRVTELTARPLLNLFYPDLAGVQQPLAGEIAARRELLERLPFVTGYGVDIALLLDAYAAVGLAGIAQVDLDVRQNAHQPLRDLGPMAFSVLRALATRLQREGRLAGPLPSGVRRPRREMSCRHWPANRWSARRWPPSAPPPEPGARSVTRTRPRPGSENAARRYENAARAARTPSADRSVKP